MKRRRRTLCIHKSIRELSLQSLRSSQKQSLTSHRVTVRWQDAVLGLQSTLEGQGPLLRNSHSPVVPQRMEVGTSIARSCSVGDRQAGRIHPTTPGQRTLCIHTTLREFKLQSLRTKGQIRTNITIVFLWGRVAPSGHFAPIVS